MDTTYDDLRQQARAKRDKIIQAAQQEYRATVRRIDSLRKLVTGEKRPAIRPPRRAKDRSLAAMVAELLPKDRPYTVADVCDLVYADPLGCQYKENSIRSALPTLAAQGLIHKVGRRSGHVLWASTASKVAACPFGAMSMAEIVENLIGEFGPMRLGEIVARMKERGFRPEEKHAITYNTVRGALTRISGRFVKDGAGRWQMVTQ